MSVGLNSALTAPPTEPAFYPLQWRVALSAEIKGTIPTPVP